MNKLHRCLRLVKSTRVRGIALPLAILIALFLPNLPAVPILGLGRVFASARALLRHTKPAQMMGEQHIVHIPYFTTSDGMTSILTLNNNMIEMATATVTLFNTKGQSLTLPSIELAPQLPARFDLGQLAKKPDFGSGNVQIAFNGMSMGITSQVSVISAAKRLAFESVEDEAMDFSSSRLDGILWLPNAETQARIALTNTTGSPLIVTASSAGPGQEEKTLTLSPHETELLEANSFIQPAQDGSAPATLLTLQHNGSPGALMVTGFAVNEKTGYSSNFPFIDRSTAASTKLAGAHVRAGSADPNEGLPAGTRFSAPLVLANAGGQQTQAAIWLDYTVNSVPHRIQVGLATLAPGQIRQFELSQALAARGIQGPLDDAGVDVTYAGAPGAVIGRLTSLDQTGDFAFDVPIKDPLAGMMRVEGSYPWRLDNGTTTVVHLKNTIDQRVEAIVQVRYDGGTYNPERVPLQPYQTVALDIAQMRDAQGRDIRGGVMPMEVLSGQVVWFEMTPGSLIGRAEVANIASGIASTFSCAGSCPCSPNFYSDSMSSCPTTGPVGGQSQLNIFETDIDCGGVNYGPYNRNNISTWATTNSSVATISGGYCTFVAPGNATITANFLATVYNAGQACAPMTVNPGAGCGVTAVSVTLALRYGQSLTVSADNDKRQNFIDCTGSDSLTTRVSNGTICSVKGRTCVEIVGTVTPSDYTGLIVIHRQGDDTRTYDGNNTLVETNTNFTDDSSDSFRDSDPQSGGSAGKVYDLDGPGPGFTPSAPVGSIARHRSNYHQWATLGVSGATVSTNTLRWYSVSSITLTSSGVQLNTAVSGDNAAGTGTTTLTWNLQ